MDKKRLSIHNDLKTVKTGMTMEEVEKFFLKYVKFLYKKKGNKIIEH